MVKKIVWIMTSCLMVLSMILTSCSSDTGSTGSVTNENEGKTIEHSGVEDNTDLDVGEEGPEVIVEKDTTKPQYGGTLTILRSTDVLAWNPLAVTAQGADGVPAIQIEQILGVDFAKGPGGTGETNYIGGVEDYRYLYGNIAESFETPEVGVWVLNIRRGIYFTNHPDQEASKLVGGRELTAEDVAYSIEYMRDNPSQSALFEPTLMQNLTVQQTGEWQITVRTPVAPTTGYLWVMGGGGVQYVWPKEFLDTYGSSNNWYDIVGTGPYIINDYVPGVAVNFIRNDNYWATNPVGSGMGDQLPYMNALKLQIIPDYSTRLAAMRTGQAEWLYGDTLERDDFETISKSNPDIKYAQTIIDPQQLAGNINLDTPFANVKVRQAMMMAIDHPALVDEFYDGKAEILDSPARKWYKSIYTPLAEQNETVQKLYGYDPEGAKALLAEAGYPDGFKMTVQMQNTPASETAFALMKEYMGAIGINLEPVVLEYSSFQGVWAGHTYGEDLILCAYPGGNGSFFVRYSMGYFRGPNLFNLSQVNNPIGTVPEIEHAYDVQAENVMINYPEADAITKETWKWVLEQAYLIPMPAPWGYRIWQPWLKNYYGASDMKFWLKWAWIDEDLKASMGK
ncbi:MAG: ABC transporter substrate-binding protein [Dehalococcoidales bacterium]|nr:ABC transporter substrate-binding protein [Dehalococcoidales bacterium]